MYGGKKPLKDETHQTWKWIGCGEVGKREGEKVTGDSHISGILRKRTGLWVGRGLHFKCVSLWSWPVDS